MKKTSRKHWGVTKTIAPKRPTRTAQARAKLGLPPIPRGLKGGMMPGPKA